MSDDSLLTLGTIESTKAAISRLLCEIEERMAELGDQVRRIRDRAKQDEQVAVERAHYEVEPLRRQMEALVLNAAQYESLQDPAAVLEP